MYLLQVETGKKRPAGSALKTPGQEKKAKLISPAGNQKTGRSFYHISGHGCQYAAFFIGSSGFILANNLFVGGGGKKTGHIATPYPAKQGKSPGNTNNSKKKGPKSAGIFSCKPCRTHTLNLSSFSFYFLFW